MFTQQQILELKSKLDYRKYYRQFLQLSGYGEWLKASCPFHDDKNPSFYIHEKSGIWHCKSSTKCGSGDIIDFHQKITGKDFVTCVMEIAQSQDIVMEISEEYKKELEEKKAIYKINNYVANLYTKSLGQCKDGQEYILSRKFDIETIKKFKLGYIPNYELKNIANGIEPLLCFSGLIYSNNYNNYFSNRRISIPFMDEYGNIVGFSSRVIDKDIKPKYLHTRTNKYFDMQNLLFGYNFAKDKIKETHTVTLCEGQIDCIRAHQYGIENCVAMCGLKISEKQLKLLHGAKNFYIVVEDTKGEEALDRLYEQIISHDFYANVKIINLRTDGEKCDLDEFLLKYGKGEFLNRIKNAHTYSEYKLIDSISKITYKSIEEKKKHIYLNKKYILGIKSLIDRNQYIELLAKKLELPENDIRRIISRADAQDRLVEVPYDEKIDNRVHVSQSYIIATFFANNFTISEIYEQMKELKIKNKLKKEFKKIFEKICDTVLTFGNKCDIINILHTENILNKDELLILDEAFFRHDDLDYLDDKYELNEFLKDQLDNLR